MPLSRINTNAIANNSVIAADIAAGTITGDKLGLTAINANNVVDASITAAKLAAGAGGQFIDNQAIHVVYFNGQNLTANLTVSANQNAFTAGPFTIDAPYQVTLNAGSTWVIL
jgi:hypothetical protein